MMYSMTFFCLHVGLGLFVIRLMNNNLCVLLRI